ncbi:MAG: chemotaxis protein CheW [Spirochaetes bacterium]|nr:chemotaxis protein CheW [Spirochaetota bacterium]
MPFSIGEYQDIFLEEADEQLQELNQSLLALEKNPEDIDIDIINSIFRTAHSLKSSAAFVGLNDLSDLAHHMENLLQGVRDKTMKMSPEIIEVLFECFDLINSIISSVSRGEEPKQDLSDTIEKIKNINENTESGHKKEIISEKHKREKSKGIDGKEALPKIHYNQKEIKIITDNLKAGKFCCELDIYLEFHAQMKWIKAQLIVYNLKQIGELLKTIPSMDDISKEWDDHIFKLVFFTDQSVEKIRGACEIDLVNKIDLKKITLSKNKDNKDALKIHGKEILFEEKNLVENDKKFTANSAVILKQDESEIEDDEHEDISFGRRKEDKRGLSLKIVKVSVDKLDLLLNTVGELVIANSGFFRLFDEVKKSNIDKSIISEFKNRMDQMSRIAKDLQSGIMKTRMVPIGQVLSRFNRPVRDLAKEFNKKINFTIKGEETELDKKVIDVIGEPMLHLLRNCIDHGVEMSEERKRLGKSEEAAVSINAYQGGNQIFVEVGDDGRGLNIEKIKKKALEKGMVTPELLENLENEDIVEFIFRPGFSTADVITDISGRGVGLNVVKEIVSELNGNVRIETEPGMGTNFVLSFPLTLAIIPAIMIKVSNEIYSIPLPDVIETIKITQSDITTIEGREVVNLRGEILSLLRLNEFIGVKSTLPDDIKIPVVIVGYGNRKIGVIVDSLEGKQEIVIKSLEENYTNIDGLSGASILGDGSICLILDISSMINRVISDEEKAIRQKKSIKTDESSIIEESALTQENIEEGLETGEKEIKPEAGKAILQKAASEKAKSEASKRIRKELEVDLRKDDDEDITEDIIFMKDDEADKETMDLDAGGDQIKTKVKETLIEFRKELEKNVNENVELDQDEQVLKSMNIAKEDIEKINVIANVGIANAAESLSKILDKSVSLSIPEIEIIPIKNIAKSIGEIDTVYVGVFMPLLGDVNGAVLFSFTEESGFELIDMLYGLSTGKTKVLDQDGESALKEVTNIIGSSMINILSEKIDLTIRPDIPTIIHDYIQSTIDSILIQNNISGDYALSMNTYFYYHDDRVLGKLLILSETESLRKMINKIKNN